MPKGESWEPERILQRRSDSSSSSSEGSFRELDDEFLQAQTRIWLGELLHLRFDLETSVADLLSDGDLLFQVSWLIWRMLVVACPDLKQLKAYKNIFRPIVYGKIGSRYLPYSNVDTYLKVCQILGLTSVDLFTPSDVVEKRDVRRVCMCIRALSKQARYRKLNVPDFDMVTYTIAMPTYIVGSIRRLWEKSRCSTSSSISSRSSTGRRKYQQRSFNEGYAKQCDSLAEEPDDAVSRFKALEGESSPLGLVREISPVNILDDLESFFMSDRSLSSNKQSMEGHECDLSNSFHTPTDSFCAYTVNNCQQKLETSSSFSALSKDISCEVNSTSETACTCFTGIRCSIFATRNGLWRLEPKLASPEISVNDPSFEFSLPSVAVLEGCHDENCHIPNTSSEDQSSWTRSMLEKNNSRRTLESEFDIGEQLVHQETKIEQIPEYYSSNQHSMLDISHEIDMPIIGGTLDFRDAILASDELGNKVILSGEYEHGDYCTVVEEDQSSDIGHHSVFLTEIIWHDMEMSTSKKPPVSLGETGVQIPLEEMVNFNRSSGQDTEKGLLIKDKAEMGNKIPNSSSVDAAFCSSDIDQLKLSMVTKCPVTSTNRTGENLSSSFLCAKNIKVLNLDSSSSYLHCPTGIRKSEFPESDNNKQGMHRSGLCSGYMKKVDKPTSHEVIHLPCVDHGRQIVPKVDNVWLHGPTMESGAHYKPESLHSEISIENLKDFHNQHKVDEAQVSKNERNEDCKVVSYCINMKEASEECETLYAKENRSEVEEDGEVGRKCRPSRKVKLLTVAGGTVFFGAIFFLFQLGRKKYVKYSTRTMLSAATKAARPHWKELNQRSLQMWSL